MSSGVHENTRILSRINVALQALGPGLGDCCRKQALSTQERQQQLRFYRKTRRRGIMICKRATSAGCVGSDIHMMTVAAISAAKDR
ncbi:uncharacterized protein MYCFIDRAFT_211547 [Pseudocercospora fijiensis CIRAD86]|uniref:Uncharacterized protein n=1 Tax=Pseudocercospora fijiensis (strain CIRAD86) TaxID=383855 RepID=M2YWM8_PSEFD|nr:uncharacterized protein MYCFIDRAFT_211547 [Pseudocercospora fijiensis CIRAD86]EME82130.1 hypothetical protein MYCFIDRAFT_183028 [Pseudocercospora fijiensis CIRAD86]